MTDVEASKHELETGEIGINSKACGLNYFIKHRTYANGRIEGVEIRVSGRGGITYLTPAQAKSACLELAGIVEQYC